MNSKISASMMCADLVHLRQTIEIFERKNIDYLHIDVMDGEFVPNFGLGVDYIRGLRELTEIPLDIHLMVRNPEYKMRYLNILKTDMVSIHYESTYQVQRAFDVLKKYDCKCFLAINPATPICMLEELLDFIDGVNVLMVNPGFSGQKIVQSTLLKVAKLKSFLADVGKELLPIEVDGNISCKNGKFLKSQGAQIFVAGTSSIFSGGISSYEQNINLLRKAIQ